MRLFIMLIELRKAIKVLVALLAVCMVRALDPVLHERPVRREVLLARAAYVVVVRIVLVPLEVFLFIVVDVAAFALVHNDVHGGRGKG